MTKTEKILLMQLLTKLIEEENQKVDAHDKALQKAYKGTEKDWGEYHIEYPVITKKAMVKDASRIIGRIGFDLGRRY